MLYTAANSMRAVLVHSPCSADDLHVRDCPVPRVGPGQVLVRVLAEGVCHRDIVERRGGFAHIARPVIPGHEFCGEIVELGADVTRLHAGLRVGLRVVNLHRAACGRCEACSAGNETRCRRAPEVFGLTVDGGYAEFVLAPAGCLVALPEGIAPEQACFLGCTAGVSLRALASIGGMRAGDRVLVTGASGGVGLHAIQIAKALGGHVVATTTSADKVAAIAAVGADEVVVAAADELHHAVRRATGGRGVDLALDCVGAPTLNAALRSLRAGGTLVVVGNVTADRWEVNAGYVILNELRVCGSAGCNRADLERVLAWVQAGVITPVVAEVLPLARAGEAQRRLEHKGAVGRIVLVP